MDMVSQMMDKMQSAITTKTAPRSAEKQKSGDSKDFNSMVQQKQKEVQERPKAQQQGTARKAPAKATEPAEGPDKGAVGDEAYSMAAMLLGQPVVVNGSGPNVKAVAEDETLPELVVNPGTENVVRPELTQKIVKNQSEVLQRTPQQGVIQAEQAPQELQQVVQRMAPKVEQGPVRVQESDTEGEDEALPVLQLQSDEPLFPDVDAVPVKVAEPSAPLPLEANDGIERLAGRLESFLAQETGDRTVQVTLSPESLGKIRIEITHSTDGALHVQLNASSERAVNLLQRGASNLQNLLTTDARPNVHVEVRHESSQQQQYFNPNDQSGQQQQQQQQQQQRRQQPQHRTAEDFMQQLRLGLVDAQ